MSDPFADPQQNKKEHGTGELRLLAHKEHKKIRLVMRRDKTLKVCANHLSERHRYNREYEMSKLCSSHRRYEDRSWVYRCHADISEGEPSNETLAVRFGNSENAKLFKEAFEKAQEANAEIFAKEKETQDASEEKAEEATTPTKETVELKFEESSESKPAEEEAKTEEATKEEAA
ncbi:hypothetical protein M422DRAFT_25931 [Sphaerobolus stellatus SS14]|nr:hypothetical protein M422DRAFT_25931 [Sphaerobolus stellatus SS14]